MFGKSKKGFTLTEVLLAMAVVGVISAMVLPQLVKSTNKDKTGTLLGKAVEQIELGCQNMIQAYNSSEEAGMSMADTLLDLEDTNYRFRLERMATYVGATRVNDSGSDAILQRHIYRFNKFPVEYSMLNTWVIPMNPNRETNIRNITIDTNGFDNRPNRGGIDQFRFMLRNDGKLIPEGLNSNSCDGDFVSNPGFNCTARVVRDGFKIKYR